MAESTDEYVERIRAENQEKIGEEPDIEGSSDTSDSSAYGDEVVDWTPSDDLIANSTFEDPLDQQGAVGTQQYRSILSAQGYSSEARRPGARLEAEPPAIYLYGEVETAGAIIYAGPRSQVRKFTPGTNYSTDKTDFTYVDDDFYDLNGLLYGLAKNASDAQAYQRLAPKTGLVDTSADVIDQVNKAKYDLTATYDMIIALSEGEVEAWGNTIEVYIAQPGRTDLPQMGVVTLHRQTATYGGSTRVWYEPGAAGDSVVSKALAGRLRVVPYLLGGATNPVTWSLAHTTYEVKRQGYNQLGQKVGSETSQGFYRSPWDHTCRLKGIAYVHIIFANSAKGAWVDAGETQIRPPTVARTVGYYDAWKGLPVFRFRIKGRKFTYPGQAVTHWTDNAAAVRYDIERTLRGVPESLIDADSVEAAVTLSNASIQLRYADSPNANVPASIGGLIKRYTISGEVLGTETLPRLEQQLDWAWQGRTNIEKGRLVFRPGKLPTTRPAITDDDVVAVGPASMTPDLGRRVNRLTDGSVAQDIFRNYLSVPLPPVVNAPFVTQDGLDFNKPLGTFRFVNNYFAALYLLHQYADLEWMRERFSFVLSPGSAATYYGITPRSVVEWQVDADQTTPVDIWQYKQTGDTYPLLWVRSVETDPFTRAVTVTVSPLTGDPFQPDLKLAVDPGDLDAIELDSQGRYDFVIGPPIAATITAFIDELKDGTHVNGIRAEWTNRYGSIGTQVRLTDDDPDPDVVLSYEVGSDARQLRELDIPDGEYQVEIRHQYPPEAGATMPQWSDWLEVDDALTVGQDTTAPAAPTNVTATDNPEGCLVTWDYPPEKDYAYTKVYFQGETDRHDIKGNEILLITDLTGSQTVYVQHVDTSGNESTATTASVTLTVPTETVEVKFSEPTIPILRQNQAIGNATFILPTATEEDGTALKSPVYSVESGLPTGLSFTASTRRITGTPTVAGNFNILYKVSATGDIVGYLWISFVIEETAETNVLFDSPSIPLLRQNQDIGNATFILPTATEADGTALTSPVYSIESGLPSGLTFSAANRRITGTPTVAGNFSMLYKVTATGDVVGYLWINFVIEEDDDDVLFDEPTIPLITQNTAITAGNFVLPTATKEDGTALKSPVYSVESDLPTGLSFTASTRRITGTPTVAGNFAILYKVSATGGIIGYLWVNFVIEKESIEVKFGSPTIPLLRQNQAVGNTAFILPEATQEDGTALTVPVYSVESGLPSGLTFSAANRRITGSPTVAGNFSMLYKVAATGGVVGYLWVNFVIEEDEDNVLFDEPTIPILIENTAITAGTFVLPTATEEDGTALKSPVYSVESDLPTGLSFTASTRRITGTPTVAGNFAILYKVSATGGIIGYLWVNFVIGVAGGRFHFGSPTIPVLIRGNAVASGDFVLPTATKDGATLKTPTYSIESGTPDGLTFAAATRQLTGTPTKAGNYVIRYKARDAGGDEGFQTYDVYVAEPQAIYPPTPMVPTSEFIFAQVKIPAEIVQNKDIISGSFVLPDAYLRGSATPNAVYSIVGALPTGLTFTATNRRITGSPSSAGSFSILYKVTVTPAFTATPVPKVTGGSGYGATIATCTVNTDGEITGITWANAGGFYEVGDVLTLTQGRKQTSYTLLSADVQTGGWIQTLTGKALAADDEVGYQRYEIEIITPASQKPPTPTGVAYTDQQDGNVRITWTTSGDFFTEVELQVNASTNPQAKSWVTLRKVDVWGQEAILNNLPSGEYRFRLRHVTINGVYGEYYT